MTPYILIIIQVKNIARGKYIQILVIFQIYFAKYFANPSPIEKQEGMILKAP